MAYLKLHQLNPTATVMVEREDGAMICAYVFSPEGVTEAPGQPFGMSFKRPPIVLLHGNGEDATHLGALIDVFRTERTVVAIDSRGQGASSRGVAPLTYEMMATDAFEVMSRLSITRAHVVGYSDGAILGLIMAKTARHRVLTLCSMGANLTPEGLTKAVRREMVETLAGLELAGAPYEGDPAWHASHRELLELMLLEPHLTQASLATIECPVLVLAGEHDAVRQSETERIAAAIRKSTLKILPGVGHDVVAEAPGEVIQLVRNHVAECDPVTRPRAPRVNDELAVIPVTSADWPLVEEVFERVLDTCEGPDPDTSGWKRGYWPDYNNVKAHLARGTMRACLWRQDVLEQDGKLVAAPGAQALGVMSVDHDIDVDESAINWDKLPESAVFCLHLFATNPLYRGNGAADTMLASFISEGLSQGVACFRLNTSPENVSSNILYQNRGFKLYRAAYLPYRGLALTPWSNCYELDARDARALRHAAEGA